MPHHFAATMVSDMTIDDPPYVRVLARAPIYDLLFACLSPRVLIHLAWTCHAAYWAVAEFQSRAFNINRHFSRYFTDPIAFRSLQARTNTLVSGSNAFQFLDRSLYPKSDLGLYTHPGHSFEVAQFLVEVEGYRYTPRNGEENDWKEATKSKWDGTQQGTVVSSGGLRAPAHVYPTPGIRAIWAFEKMGTNQERLKVQIVEGLSSPFESILGFHSTCVMNLISSDAAYALYPVATFEDQISLDMPSSRSSETTVQKYVKHTYFVPPGNGDLAFFLNRARWVGDKHTWRLPLDQAGVQARPALSPTSAPFPCDPVLFNGWKLRSHRGHFLNGYECHYHPLRTALFRYNYVIPDAVGSFAVAYWALFQGRYSHLQVAAEDWTWFDADIPRFLQNK